MALGRHDDADNEPRGKKYRFLAQGGLGFDAVEDAAQ